MPTSKSAEKRMRTSARRQEANRVVKSRVRTMRKKFLDAIEAGDRDRAVQAGSAFSSTLDRARKQGVVKANTVARNKSRAAKKIAALASGSSE